ncbi:MAG: arylesterase [Planctomycetes bacterium]|nr:arylesterase [Planctomycetota bacterium]
MRLALAALALAFALGCKEEPSPSRDQPLDGPARTTEAPAPAPKAPEIPPGSPKVAFLGDSITAGLHLSSEFAFPAVLQRDFAAAGMPFELVNAGVSGDTSAGGHRRIDFLLQSKPDIVVIELGGNDGLRGQPAEVVDANLRSIVYKCRAKYARVLLLGVQLPVSLGSEYVTQFEELYPCISRQLSVSFVPNFMDGVGGVPTMNLPDGLHPTAKGHERIAQNVAPGLREVLNELGRR